MNLTPAADADVIGIEDWYNTERPDRPDLLRRFDRALLKALNSIANNPEAFAADQTGTRHVRLKGVPYAAFVKLNSDGMAVVFAITHDKQDPKVWQSRA